MADPLGLAILSTNTNVFPDDLWLTHFTLITAYVIALFVNFVAFPDVFFPHLFSMLFVSFIFVLFPFLPPSSRCVKETDDIILHQLYFVCSCLSENTRDYEGIVHLFRSRWRCSVKQRDARHALCTWRGTEGRFKVLEGRLSCTNCVIRPWNVWL